VKPKPYTRVTTLVGKIQDRHNLEQWAQRAVAVGLAERADLLAAVAANRTNPRELNRVVADAKDAGGGMIGANLGTALHTMLEQTLTGETPLEQVGEQWRHDITAVHQALNVHGLRPVDGMTERIVRCDELAVAGTFDLAVTFPGRELPVIADLKTGRSVDFGFVTYAAQLAIYAHADGIWLGDLERDRFGRYMLDPGNEQLWEPAQFDQQIGVLIHAPAGQGTCTIHTVDLEFGWEQAHLARRVYDSQKTKQPRVLTPLPAVDRSTELVTNLTERLQALPPEAVAVCRQHWPKGVPTLKQARETGAPLTAGQIAAITATVEIAEAFTGAQFNPPTTITATQPAPAPAAPTKPHLAAVADPALVDKLINEIQDLPADLVDTITNQAKEAGIGNLRRGVTVTQAAQIQQWVTGAAAELGTRLGTVYAAQTKCGPAVLELCGITDPEKPTSLEVSKLRAVGWAIRRNVLNAELTPTGECEIGKGAMLAAGRVMAGMFGLPSPNSSAEVLTNPLLLALVVHHTDHEGEK